MNLSSIRKSEATKVLWLEIRNLLEEFIYLLEEFIRGIKDVYNFWKFWEDEVRRPFKKYFRKSHETGFAGKLQPMLSTPCSTIVADS